MKGDKVKIQLAASCLLLGVCVCAMGDSLAYEATGSNNFGLLDLNTGAYTQLGTSGTRLAGLGEFGGALYGSESSGSTLYSVNTNNGSLTSIGSGTISYYDFGSTTNGLYGLGNVGGNFALYSVNPNNGSTTLVGSTGLPIGSSYVVGLSSGSNSLYMGLGSSNANLYSLNLTTGQATLIGPTGLTGVGALVSENGSLWAGQYNGTPYSIATLNTSTGASTIISAESPSTYGQFWGLAGAPVTVPEIDANSGTSALALLAGVLLMVRGRRAKA